MALAKQVVESVEPAFDKHHMCDTEKMPMARNIGYRQECEQTLLDAGFKC